MTFQEVWGGGNRLQRLLRTPGGGMRMGLDEGSMKGGRYVERVGLLISPYL